MASTQASSSNPSKKIKLTIIPPRQLFVNISSDEDVTTTPSPITISSSPSPPNAPSKTPSTKGTSSTFGTTSFLFESRPQSSPPTSNDTPSPQPSNPFLDNIMDAPLRPSHPLPLQRVICEDILKGAYFGAKTKTFEDYLILTNTPYPRKEIRRISAKSSQENTFNQFPIRCTHLLPYVCISLKRRLFETPGLVESSSPELDLFSDIKENSEEETTEIMMETMEQYISKTRGNYGSRVVRPKINDKTHFELKGQYLKELRENAFSGPEHETQTYTSKKSLKSLTYFIFPRFNHKLGNPENEVFDKYCPHARTAKKIEEINNFQQEPDEIILFYNGLDVPTRQILDSKGAIPTKTVADAKIAIQEIAEYSQKWHNGTSSKSGSTETFDGLAAIQAQLNNLEREMKKVNEKVYAAQVRRELCMGPHYTKDCPLKEEGNTLEEAYYTQFGAPYQPAGQYKAAGPGFYQRNNGNSSYPDRRQTLEESLTKFIAESAKRHEENSNIIKEIRASTDAVIRNQGSSIKTLEIQIGQMSKVLQERGIEGLPGSTEPNPGDHVKSISTTKVDSSETRRMGCNPYAVSSSQHRSMFSKTVPY
ncbi:hypothetical protein Tco_1030965 [Tanacetum coccineum]|uniref:Retrotransposon gag domain-containing protein n=1 Tax=Tanacetum coccineum TaxID=301880 RepID=A0ABQ5G7U7_9ASTR